MRSSETARNQFALEDAYASVATAAPSLSDEVDHHYLCWVKSDGRLWELDHDMDGPIARESMDESEDMLRRGAWRP